MERLVHKALNGENDGKYSGKKTSRRQWFNNLFSKRIFMSAFICIWINLQPTQNFYSFLFLLISILVFS